MEKEKIDNNTTENYINKQFIFSKKIWLIDKYNFYEYLSVMLDWGVSISEALDSVSDKISSIFFKEKIKEIVTYIYSWDSFSKSMKKIPQVFSNAEISIIEAWETTWTLVEAMLKISEDLKKIHNLRSKVRAALTYPIIIFLFLFLAILIVLMYVIPSIMPLFETSEIELPLATKALISTSNFIQNNYALIFLALFSIYVFILWYKNTVTWKANIEKFILDIPLIWRVYKNYILSNLIWTFWGLIWSWVNVVKTLTLVWKSTNNIIYEWLFDDIAVKVSKWWKIVDSMREVDPDKYYFPSDFLQMLHVWEKTASLEKISKKINSQYEREVEYSLSNLTKWIEPLAILLAWIFVLWFAFAIFWAILKVTEAVS